MAVHTPADRIPSHGTDMLGQRYAFDLVRFDPRRGTRDHPRGGPLSALVGIPTRECPGWGETVHAPLDGEVVVAHDGIAEPTRVIPLRQLALVVKNGVTFRPTSRALLRVLGNHVILRCGDVYAGFAHLVPGSVAVASGAHVRTGDVLGRVGTTGNSSMPHLHFQLMDGPDPLTARGVACAFRAYEVEGADGTWRRVEGSVPRGTERIRWVADDRRRMDPR
ncbi:MAG: M23 family metallopeptidase [Chloroflexi bacterium]|jgi:murein DD-endopeptidase MepM/ murein hydrolase activator NlpD|nr:M23 family metallopeptidase [Chloroflexota bacterium]